MNCERVLSSLATGGPVTRWLAQRHANRCPVCARAQILLQNLTRELAAAPPLTAAQRALWTAASAEARASRARAVWVYPAGLAAATVLLSVIGMRLWQTQRGGTEHELPVVQFNPKPARTNLVEPTERSKLADEMLAKVDRLDHELAELRREADLLDVRKDANALWNRYAPRKQSAL
jgi:hypothetical protein